MKELFPILVLAWTEHFITIYLPKSPLLIFLLGFLGVFVIFRVIVYLIDAIPFM